MVVGLSELGQAITEITAVGQESGPQLNWVGVISYYIIL